MLILYCFSPFIPPKLSRATVSKNHSRPDISGLGSLQSWSHEVHTPRQIPPATRHSSSREVKTFLQKSRFSFWRWWLRLHKKHWMTKFTGGKPVRDHYPGCCTNGSCWFVGVSLKRLLRWGNPSNGLKKTKKNTDNQKNAEHQNLIISQADNLSILVNSDGVCGSHWQPVKTSLRKKNNNNGENIICSLFPVEK